MYVCEYSPEVACHLVVTTLAAPAFLGEIAARGVLAAVGILFAAVDTRPLLAVPLEIVAWQSSVFVMFLIERSLLVRIWYGVV